jgi:hypothetical protein
MPAFFSQPKSHSLLLVKSTATFINISHQISLAKTFPVLNMFNIPPFFNYKPLSCAIPNMTYRKDCNTLGFDRKRKEILAGTWRHSTKELVGNEEKAVIL